MKEETLEDYLEAYIRHVLLKEELASQQKKSDGEIIILKHICEGALLKFGIKEKEFIGLAGKKMIEDETDREFKKQIDLIGVE